MAQSLVAELNVPMGTDLGAGASARLLGVLDGLEDLLELRSDDAVHTLAHRLSEQVTLVSERMVELLRGYEARFETVGQWLEAAAVLGREGAGKVAITANGVEDTAFSATPGEMEDTLEELVRNAFLHDATTVQVSAMKHSGHLCLSVRDDGRGMSDDKLKQLRRVLETRDYDATLSTRKDGTGNGLLSAVNAVERFIDGRFSVEHGPQGRGVEFSISMKLPG